MSHMHKFYRRLNQPIEAADPYFQGLAQLKQASRASVSTLASELEWFNWGAAGGDRPAAA